jgi:SAM-dependent methyltransferase
MQIADLHFLLTPEGQRLLHETADPPITPSNHLQVASRLRKHLDPVLAQTLIETVLLRQRAAKKFSRSAEMYFTRPALEQASSEVVAVYRAAKYERAGLKLIADLGCGIGGDAIALSAQAEVIGIDLDLLRLAMARENVRSYGNCDHFLPLQSDMTTLPAPHAQAFYFDPGRRDENGRRLHSVTHYQPPLSTIDRWRSEIAHGAVKISPAVDYAELPAEAEVEFISLRGKVKEGVLWYGDLRLGPARHATLLPAGHTLSSDDYPGEPVPVGPPSTYLYEPDGAVIRAHLVQTMARHLGCDQIDPQIAYLTANSYHDTPFARCFSLEAWFPFQLKRLRSYLRANNIGRVTIKKRGSPIDLDHFHQQLRLKGDEHRILFLTHVMGKPAVLIGDEVTEAVMLSEKPVVG